MDRFDVDYIDEERGIKNIPCDDGDYVLAEDALKLQAKNANQCAVIISLQAKVEEQDKVFTETFNLMQHHLMDSQQLQAKVEELQAEIEGWKEAYEEYLDDHNSDFIPPEDEL